MQQQIIEKLLLANQLSLQIMAEGDNMSVIKIATEEAKKIFGADFGFAWGEFQIKDSYKIVYTTKDLIAKQIFPFEKKNQHPGQNIPIYDSDVQQINYKNKMSPSLKSYLIIPIHYFDHSYGNIVLGYKQKQNFTKEEIVLCHTLGNSIAQTVTINWVVENEHQALLLAEKQKETEILLAQEKSKNEFIANITHEFRTPLTIMRGYIYLASKSKKTAEGLKATQDALKVIDNEIVHLSEMLSDLVLVTSGNSLPVHFTPIDLVEIIASIQKRLQPHAQEKAIKISVKNKSKKIVITGDQRYLERMFLNIIKNAITYGGSKIDISIETKKNNVTIIIKDDGIGISSEDLPKIFERFYRADKSRTRSENRSGLGLSIAQMIAEMHGGTIDVKSALGKGSVFTVSMPLRKSSTR